LKIYNIIVFTSPIIEEKIWWCLIRSWASTSFMCVTQNNFLLEN